MEDQTPRVRAELQASQETSSALVQRYGLSRTTVIKWRTRTTTDDAPMGPSLPHSTVLTLAEEAMVVEFRDDAGKMNGAEFLRGVVEAFPYAIHTVLTDNGMAFADLPKNRNGPTRRYLGAHIFDRVCAEHGIEHKRTLPYHPWTNGQANA